MNPLNANCTSILSAYNRLAAIFKAPNLVSEYECDAGKAQPSPGQYYKMWMDQMQYYQKVALWSNIKAWKDRDTRWKKKTLDKNGKVTYTYRLIHPVMLLTYNLAEIAMGFNPKPRLKDHWDKNFGTETVKLLLGRKEFMMIRKALVFRDPRLDEQRLRADPDAESDHSYKFRFMFEDLNNVCQYFMHWPQRVACDENIIALFNRTMLKQKIRAVKPRPVGIRCFDFANEWGYVFVTVMDCKHTRKELEKYSHLLERHRPRIVLYLCELVSIYRKPGSKIFVDTYYNNVPLQLYLGSRQIFVNGTMQSGFQHRPSNYNKNGNKLLAKGESKYYTGFVNNKAALKYEYLHKNPTTLHLQVAFDQKIFLHLTNEPCDPQKMEFTSLGAKRHEKQEASLNAHIQNKREEYSAMSYKHELRPLCRSKGIAIRNRKDVLIDQLLDLDARDYESKEASETPKSNNIDDRAKNSSIANNNNNSNNIEKNSSDISVISRNNNNNSNDSNISSNSSAKTKPNTQVYPNLSELTKIELKQQCKQRNLQVSGNKDELVARIRKFDADSVKNTGSLVARKVASIREKNLSSLYGRLTAAPWVCLVEASN